MNHPKKDVMHAARELALNLLFQMDVAHLSAEEAFQTARENAKTDPESIEQAIAFADGVLERQARLDSVLNELSPEWPADRQPSVDRNILRLAMFEMSFYQQTPQAVVIDEAIELAKKFSTEDSGRFVNGVLGEFMRRFNNRELSIK